MLYREAPSAQKTSLTKRVIACLDVAGGRVVKGVNFLQLRDAGNPVELAQYYDKARADELVFLDITASNENRSLLLDLIRTTTESVFIPVTVGGGVNSVDDVKTLLSVGADKVSINSAAVREPELISRAADAFGKQCIVVAIDARHTQATQSGWEVFTHGGKRATGRDAVEWACRAAELGAGEILLTSMDRDGTKHGYDLALTLAISSAVRVPVVASGGAGEPQHLVEVLTEGGADAALAASIFHYGQYTIQQTKEVLAAAGIAVRL
ncbi:MAG: imidazole glycerol phosphate synthase subunit HisF [Chloroflexia bacterium]